MTRRRGSAGYCLPAMRACAVVTVAGRANASGEEPHVRAGTIVGSL